MKTTVLIFFFLFSGLSYGDSITPVILDQDYVQSVQLLANGAPKIPAGFVGLLTIQAVVTVGISRGSCSPEQDVFVTPGATSGSFVIGSPQLNCANQMVMKTITFDARTFIVRTSDGANDLKSQSVTVNQKSVSLLSLVP